MDEDNQRASTSATATTASSKPTVPAKECAVMLVRFPDTDLSAFRDSIQREQNNLLDNEEAFLAALCPQPITGLLKPNEEWPDRAALAVLVFPDMRSGEEWLSGVSEKGDNWYSGCDAVIMPAKWTVPRESTGRLVFSVTAVKTREGITKPQMLAFCKNILPCFSKVRQDWEGHRQAATKTFKTLHGTWAPEYTVALTHWPKVDNYFAYREALKKGDFPKYQEEYRALFESHSVLAFSEDVTSLSSQPTLVLEDDDMQTSEESGDKDDEADDDDRAENLLVTNEEHFSQ